MQVPVGQVTLHLLAAGVDVHRKPDAQAGEAGQGQIHERHVGDRAQRLGQDLGERSQPDPNGLGGGEASAGRIATLARDRLEVMRARSEAVERRTRAALAEPVQARGRWPRLRELLTGFPPVPAEFTACPPGRIADLLAAPVSAPGSGPGPYTWSSPTTGSSRSSGSPG